MPLALCHKSVRPYCGRILSFENGLKLRLKSVAVFSDDLGLNGSGLKVRRKAKKSSENLISKFSDDLLPTSARQAEKALYAIEAIISKTVTTKTLRMISPSELIAWRLPKWLPNKFAKIIGIPIRNAIFPAIKKATNAPILEAKLKILEVAEACNNDNLLMTNKAIMKMLPVPGPKKPS